MSVAMLRGTPDLAHQARFQLWTDALCLRQMANQAGTNYLRSMCVRNAVMLAWTTLEMACRDALGVEQFDNENQGFIKALRDALKKNCDIELEIGSGTWQRLNADVRPTRKTYVHQGLSMNERFPPVSRADEAIRQVREGIRDIYTKTGKPVPKWIDADDSKGWPTGGFGGSAKVYAVKAGAREDDPETIRIVLIGSDAKEKPVIYLPPATSEEEIETIVEDTIGGLNAPFSGVRVYRGPTLLREELFEMR